VNQAAVEKFIEASGIQLELDVGAPRMVGRVLGWLLICDPPEQSAAELAENLQASRGSISTATRVLIRTGLIERLRHRGERFDRFVARPEGWDKMMWDESQVAEPRRVLQLGLDALRDEPSERRERLEELDRMYLWWEKRLPELREEYLEHRRRERENTRGGK
jgi:DNA-binding transcriptional regulator GbsR (MarR family)